MKKTENIRKAEEQKPIKTKIVNNLIQVAISKKNSAESS